MKLFEAEFEIAGVGIIGGLILSAKDPISRRSNFLFLNDLSRVERAKFDEIARTNKTVKLVIMGVHGE